MIEKTNIMKIKIRSRTRDSIILNDIFVLLNFKLNKFIYFHLTSDVMNLAYNNESFSVSIYTIALITYQVTKIIKTVNHIIIK